MHAAELHPYIRQVGNRVEALQKLSRRSLTRLIHNASLEVS
jgi:hypothetical protein